MATLSWFLRLLRIQYRVEIFWLRMGSNLRVGLSRETGTVCYLHCRVILVPDTTSTSSSAGALVSAVSRNPEGETVRPESAGNCPY